MVNSMPVDIRTKEIADALIAAGIGFMDDEITSQIVATIKRDTEPITMENVALRKQVAEAEHRAEVAERALKISSLKIATIIDEEAPDCVVCKNYQSCNLTVGECSGYMEKCCVKQAERELAEEGE